MDKTISSSLAALSTDDDTKELATDAVKDEIVLDNMDVIPPCSKCGCSVVVCTRNVDDQKREALRDLMLVIEKHRNYIDTIMTAFFTDIRTIEKSIGRPMYKNETNEKAATMRVEKIVEMYFRMSDAIEDFDEFVTFEEYADAADLPLAERETYCPNCSVSSVDDDASEEENVDV